VVGNVQGPLTDNVIVVTGGAQGLGLAIARKLNAQGAIVAIADVNPDGARAASDELIAAGGRSIAITCDISDPDSVREARITVEKAFSKVDGLVNNAGILPKASLENETIEGWDRMLSVNLRGAFLATQQFGEMMRAQGAGSIVNIGSIGGTVPTLDAGAYCVSKAGILALTRQTALEWGKYGIRANSVSPGYMDTPMTKDRYAVPGMREQRAAMIPLGRIADPADVAGAVVFLMTPEASYISGQEILVDGAFKLTTTSRVPQPKA
jgi:NAD(P)-dependent dehydrogenase (short-subunit alcohol dehydrogenase family)